MKRIRFALIVLMLSVALFALGACGVDRISVSGTDAPRTTYVRGQELDRSIGKLIVTSGKKTEEIPLSDEGVEITGYDKDKTGEQELTVTYEEQTATYTVTVVERMVGEGIETEYLVGESLNRARGQVRITKDDGTSFTVPFSDPSLAVTFDSSAAGTPVSVPVSYSGANGTFSGSVAVNVYAPEQANFTRPSKTSYRSHEELNLAGGYFTFTANGGKLTRYIQLTPDMVEGFDLSQATIANRTQPLEQSVTVRYLDQVGKFTIRITFSDVSLIRQRAGECANIDWQGSPSVSETQGENAVEAMGLYFALPGEEKSLIAEEDLMRVMRTAAYYGRRVWQQEADSYKNTFTVQDGMVIFTEGHYTDAKRDATRLKDETQPLYTVGDVLVKIRSAFGSETMLGEELVSAYLANVLAPAELPDVVGRLDFMLSLYETLKDVPANWQEDHSRLTAHTAELDSALDCITACKYDESADRDLFGVVASWRETGDFFEMLYWFNLDRYLSDDRTESNLGATALNTLMQHYFPGPLEELYETCILAYTFMQGMASQQVVDSTYFMICYDRIEELREEVYGSEEVLYAVIYELAGLDSVVTTVRAGEYGYFYQCDALLGDEAFDAIWEEYIALANKLLANADYAESAAFGRELEALFASYLALTPAEQFGFLSSVNVFYREGLPAYAWDTAEGAYTEFVGLIVSYYSEQLSEAGADLFRELLLVLENYALTGVEDEAMDAFLAGMRAAQTSYQSLSAADKRDFDRLAGGLYTECKDYYDYAMSSLRPDLGTWEEKFEELAVTLDEIYFSYMLMQSGTSMYTPFFAACEKAELLRSEILASGNDDVLDAYLHVPFQFSYLGSYTFDFAVYLCRSLCNSLLTGITVDDYPLYDFYTEYDMTAFLAAAEPVYWAAVNGETEEDGYKADASLIKAVTAAFRELSPEAQNLFYLLDYFAADEESGGYWYYESLMAILETVLTEQGMNIASELFTLEQAYSMYRSDPEGVLQDGTTYAEYVKALADQLKEDYEDVSTFPPLERVNFNTYLSDTYQYYIKACSEL